MIESNKLKARLYQNIVNKCSLFNQPCLLCQQHNSHAICQRCFSQLMNNSAACPSCAMPLSQLNLNCQYCHNQHYYFSQAYSAFIYQDDISKLLQQIKYEGQLFALPQLCTELLQNLQSIPDALTFVPSFDQRLKKRGYNQSYLITRYLSQKLKIPIFNGIRKIKDYPSLIDCNKKQRQQMVHNAFKVEKQPPKQLAIIDDLLTTGSTCNEISKHLSLFGCDNIQVWTLARTLL